MLTEFRSQPAGFHKVADGPRVVHLRSKTLASSNDVPEEKLWDRYREVVAQVGQLWEQPAYEGPGARAGHKDDCPSADEYLRELYTKALRIAWWKRDRFVHAVILTGHDANALQMLHLAVAEAGEA
jgi:hypothetical protein